MSSENTGRLELFSESYMYQPTCVLIRSITVVAPPTLCSSPVLFRLLEALEGCVCNVDREQGSPQVVACSTLSPPIFISPVSFTNHLKLGHNSLMGLTPLVWEQLYQYDQEDCIWRCSLTYVLIGQCENFGFWHKLLQIEYCGMFTALIPHCLVQPLHFMWKGGESSHVAAIEMLSVNIRGSRQSMCYTFPVQKHSSILRLLSCWMCFSTIRKARENRWCGCWSVLSSLFS